MSRIRNRSSDKDKKSLVRLANDLARSVRTISSALDITTTEYIDSRLRPVVERELPGVLRAMTEAK